MKNHWEIVESQSVIQSNKFEGHGIEMRVPFEIPEFSKKFGGKFRKFEITRIDNVPLNPNMSSVESVWRKNRGVIKMQRGYSSN